YVPEQLTSSAAGPAALRLLPSPTTKVGRRATSIAPAQRSGRIDSGKAAAVAFGAEFLPRSLIVPGNSATTAIGGTIRTRSGPFSLCNIQRLSSHTYAERTLFIYADTRRLSCDTHAEQTL
ncbi:hypothetical protein, partial [Paenibacillus lactis]|uniref:hypothetical protein n=1 Tax=Paenibacillus lactis TaxID=228574 RepID=UPI003687B0BB